jgi:hypothetical protein
MMISTIGGNPDYLQNILRYAFIPLKEVCQPASNWVTLPDRPLTGFKLAGQPARSGRPKTGRGKNLLIPVIFSFMI